jgi:hypothetical protein
MKHYSFDDTTIISFANQIKELALFVMERDGLLDPKLRVAERYAFVLSSRGVLGKLIDKLLNQNDDGDLLGVSFVEVCKPSITPGNE